MSCTPHVPYLHICPCTPPDVSVDIYTSVWPYMPYGHVCCHTPLWPCMPLSPYTPLCHHMPSVLCTPTYVPMDMFTPVWTYVPLYAPMAMYAPFSRINLHGPHAHPYGHVHPYMPHMAWGHLCSYAPICNGDACPLHSCMPQFWLALVVNQWDEYFPIPSSENVCCPIIDELSDS